MRKVKCKRLTQSCVLTMAIVGLAVIVCLWMSGDGLAQQETNDEVANAAAGKPAEGIDTAGAEDPNRQKARLTELQRRQYKLTLLVIIVAIIALFTVIMLLTIIRVGRHRRRMLQLGKRNKPTEYVDAWSQYRLDEDTEGKGDYQTEKDST